MVRWHGLKEDPVNTRDGADVLVRADPDARQCGLVPILCRCDSGFSQRSCRVVLAPHSRRRQTLSRPPHLRNRARFKNDHRVKCLLCRNTVLPRSTLHSPSPDGKGWQMLGKRSQRTSRRSSNSSWNRGYPNLWLCSSLARKAPTHPRRRGQRRAGGQHEEAGR